MSNVLDLFDQTVFLGERATGATNLLQCVWIYDRAIDIDGLRQFHRHLQQGRLSRRVERSACRSVAIAGSRPAVSPNLRSSRRLARAKNSTPGWASWPTLRWMPSTDPVGTLRWSGSPTAARG